jgi:CBS domain-containing protein
MSTTFLLIVILDDLDRLPDLLTAWRNIGVGATLLHSQGGYRVSSWLDRIGLGGLNRLLEQDNVGHTQKLLLSLVQDEDLLNKAIGEAERAVGGFDRPNSGVLFTLPVGNVLGASKWKLPTEISEEEEERWFELDQGIFARIDPETAVSEIAKVLDLNPCTVHRTDTIEQVVRVMLANPSVKVVSVVNDENHLVGLIETTTLSESIFFSIFPEAYLSDFRDVDEVLDFVKQPHNIHIAADIMEKPEFVRLDDTLKKAFHIMHKRKLAGVPVVDQQNRVAGYINLLELLAVCFLKENGGSKSSGEASDD